jgi:hypothetical protein
VSHPVGRIYGILLVSLLIAGVVLFASYKAGGGRMLQRAGGIIECIAILALLIEFRRKEHTRTKYQAMLERFGQPTSASKQERIVDTALVCRAVALALLAIIGTLLSSFGDLIP